MVITHNGFNNICGSMAELMVDEFGIKKICRNSRNPKRAKPWLLGIGDWKSRQHDWDGEITSHFDEGFLRLNIKRYIYDDDPFGVGQRLNHKISGRGRNPVLAVSGQESVVHWKQSEDIKKGIHDNSSGLEECGGYSIYQSK